MAQLSDDCFAGDDALVPAQAALDLILPRLSRVTDRKAGEDVAAASRALAAGIRLRPQDIGLAAALGLTRLPVAGRLKVALFSTGDELAEPGAALGPGAIYDSNRFTLAALLAQLGCA